MRRTRTSSNRGSSWGVWAALGAILLVHALALPQAFTHFPLRADSDTAVMLDAVQRAGGVSGAWRWFVGDWLLENGFYRPISSLSIVVDYTVYGETAWGFRLTNWLLMVLTTVGAFFLTREYARLIAYPRADGLATGVALALSLQQTGLTHTLGRWSAWWLVGLVVIGMVIAQRRAGAPNAVLREAVRPHWLPLMFALGALFWGFDRLLETHYTRLITWVPSRTALLGTMFSVWTMYCLLRGASARCRGWLGLGGAFYLLALGSYEQPIMLIPLIGALAFWRRRQWSAWGWKA
ncbi:MAG: hypothetical protein ACK4RG_06030, partial [Fimbriimonadales bacterium]